MGSTAVSGPAYPAFQPAAPHDLYRNRVASSSTHEFIMRTERSSARASMPPTPMPMCRPSATAARPARRSLQAPLTMEAVPTGGAAGEFLPMQTYNRPRRLSSNSATTISSSSGSMVSAADMWSRSSASPRSSFESWHSLSSRQQQQFPWLRQAPIKPLKKSKPGEQFARLPGQALELILEYLRQLHLAAGSNSCATCLMRDLSSVSLSARKFLKYARVALYENIQLVGAESAALKKRYKLANCARIVLLRRTLRNNPQIANIVRTLKVPSPPTGMPLDEYHDIVASLVKACPNLERVVGFYPPYNHSFTRLIHAMSTRQRLKQMDWILEASPFQRQHRLHSTPGHSVVSMQSGQSQLIAPGDLQPFQSEAFLEIHANWQYLTTLTVHCQPGATLSPDALLSTTLAYLPSLQNLHLSRLPHTSFSDANLLGLPSLRTLSLSYMTGITNNGFSAFATRVSSQSIRKLTLRHMNLDSLATLARMLSNLVSLETFCLVQAWPPVLPIDEFICLFPYLASASIRKLHWDITSHPNCANIADSILARSIAANGFPSLRVLRTPNDPEGIFQALCKPQERVDQPIDRYRGVPGANGSLLSGQRFTPPSTPTIKSSPASSPTFPPPNMHMLDNISSNSGAPRDCTDLRLARLAAQARLEQARHQPRYFLTVIDENGAVIEKCGFPGFMGTVESRIEYCLTPDPGATDEEGGLVGIPALLRDGGEDLRGGAGEGCTGKWNARNGNVSDRRDKERWRHTERGRWRGVVLS